MAVFFDSGKQHANFHQKMLECSAQNFSFVSKFSIVEEFSLRTVVCCILGKNLTS